MAANATDTTDIKFRDRSAFNQAAILLNSKKYDQAAVVFEQYLKWVPNDNEAKRGLAAAYRGLGKVEQAQALEKEPGGGRRRRRARPAPRAAQDLMAAGVNLYNDKKYAEAAAAFEKLTAAEPNNRDALSNLSNTYLALNDGPKLLDAATRLAAIEPLSENALKLKREGYRLSKQVDEALKVAETVLALPADVKVDDLTATGTGATLTATATGRAAMTATGKPIPAAAVPIVVEFLNATGGVVATQEAVVPALAESASEPIKVTAQGAGITAWRYRRK